MTGTHRPVGLKVRGKEGKESKGIVTKVLSGGTVVSYGTNLYFLQYITCHFCPQHA